MNHGQNTVISDSDKIVSNSVYSAVSEFSLVFTSVFYILAARFLGDEIYGELMSSAAIVGLFMLFVVYGFNYSMTKVVVRAREKAGVYVGNALLIQSVFALACLAICYGLITGLDRWIPGSKFPPSFRLVIVIVFIGESIKSFNLTVRMTCKALGKFKYDTIAVVLERTFLLLIGGFVLIRGYGLMAAVFALLSARVIGFVFLISMMRRLDAGVSQKPDIETCKFLLRESWFYVAQSAIWRIYDHLDVVMIYLLRNRKEVGWYGAARKIFEGLWLIPNILTEAVYPELSARHLVSREHVYRLFNRSLKYMLTVSVMVAIGTLIIAPGLIKLVFGPEFENSVIVLSLFGVAVVPSYLRYLFGTTLIAINQQKKEMKLAAGRSAFNVAANFSLIPFYGFLGATIATVATEYVVMIPYIQILKKEDLIRREQLSYAFKPFLALLMLIPVWLLIRNWADILVLFILIAGYTIAVLLLRIFDKEELALVRRFMARAGRRGK